MAIFCHLATRLAASTEQLHGNLVLLFDLDEHTGRFGGATRYFEGPDAPSDVAGVMIGYPGMNTRPTLVQLTSRWPAYALPAGSPLRTTLLETAHALGVDVEPKVDPRGHRDLPQQARMVRSYGTTTPPLLRKIG